MPRFIQGPQTKLSTNDSADYELVWGASKDPEELKSSGSSIIHVEDGFIRSKGLGANFHLPLSLVFDDIGIYYDARARHG